MNLPSTGSSEHCSEQCSAHMWNGPESANFCLAERPESWHFLALVQKIVCYTWLHQEAGKVKECSKSQVAGIL